MWEKAKLMLFSFFFDKIFNAEYKLLCPFDVSSLININIRSKVQYKQTKLRDRFVYNCFKKMNH